MTAELTEASAGVEPRARRGAFVDAWALLAVPGLIFLTLFFVLPLVRMATRSLSDPGPANYEVFFGSSLYVKVLWTTVRTSVIVTVACLLLGYPYAYVMHHAGRKVQALLAALVLIPFWSSLLVRSYAWTVLLQDSGVINSLLARWGLIDEPLALMRNTLGVTIGMSHILLPFMVLPIFAVMRRIDPEYGRAAANLGASPIRSFLRVFVPLSLPGVVAGCLLVFVLALGFYITPALLGGLRDQMISQLIVQQVQQRLDWGFGSAMSVLLMLATLVILVIASRAVRLRDVFGSAVEE